MITKTKGERTEDDDENRREGLATLLRPLERQGECRERERGKERTVIVFFSSSYYKSIYTESRTLRTRDTDKKKPIEEGGS